MKTRATLTLVALIVFALSLSWAQQKQAIAWSSPDEASEYVDDFRIDVNDVPGHFVRATSLTWDFSLMNPVPSFNGVKVTSAFSALTTDYFDFNGSAQGYMVFTLENGDKIFSDFSGATQTTFLDDGSLSSSTFAGLLTLTSGTGDFANIRGLIRQASHWNLATDKSVITPTTFEGEYWFMGQQEASN